MIKDLVYFSPILELIGILAAVAIIGFFIIAIRNIIEKEDENRKGKL